MLGGAMRQVGIFAARGAACARAPRRRPAGRPRERTPRRRAARREPAHRARSRHGADEHRRLRARGGRPTRRRSWRRRVPKACGSTRSGRGRSVRSPTATSLARSAPRRRGAGARRRSPP
jgi:hypothetical protein